MFIQFEDTLKEVSIDKINARKLTAGFINAGELKKNEKLLGFSPSTVESCQKANKYFRSDVEIYDDYLFTELRIATPKSTTDFDCLALYIKKNLVLVVDVEDYDDSTRKIFRKAINRFPSSNMTVEKLVFAFIDALVSNDLQYIEDMGNTITRLEEDVIKDEVDNDFNSQLLNIKKEFLTMHNYYEQLLDITDAIEENENEIFNEAHLMYISNVSHKVSRLRKDIDSLSSSVNHLQDAYSASIDIRLNNVMKRFTVITSIFFPLTLIVGWYGMNFVHMPEFAWKYGYLYVIALSAVVVLVLMLIGKKKKWY